MDKLKPYLDKIDIKTFGMSDNQKYDYLLNRFNKAFEVNPAFTEKNELMFKAIIQRLSELEDEIKNS